MATSEIVEIVATIAHVTPINLFENAIAAFKDVAPMRALEVSTPVLQEVQAKLGDIPRSMRATSRA